MLLCVIRKQMELSGEIKRDVKKQTRTEANRAEYQIKTLQKEIEVRQAAKAQSYMEYRAGETTKEEFLERKEKLQREIAEKEVRVEEVRNTKEEGLEEKQEIVEALSGYQNIEKLDRGIIEALVDTIWVYDVGKVKVEWKFPLRVSG